MYSVITLTPSSFSREMEAHLAPTMIQKIKLLCHPTRIFPYLITSRIYALFNRAELIAFV